MIVPLTALLWAFLCAGMLQRFSTWRPCFGPGLDAKLAGWHTAPSLSGGCIYVG